MTVYDPAAPAIETAYAQGPRSPRHLVARLLWGDRGERRYVLTAWLFLRGLGVVYLIAFASLGGQILGLYGSQGILPAAELVARAREALTGVDVLTRFPSLLLLDSSDAALWGLCAAGAVLAILLILDVLSAPALIGLWVVYLSLMTVGRVFLSFQWDILLLETGFLAIFLGHRGLPLTQRREPSLVVLLLLRWLLFRLMFSSGAVKFLSGDPTWAGFTALEYHYFTQPIPNPVAWTMHQLPAWFQQLSQAVMLVIELAVPFLYALPRRPRMLGAALTAGLMVLILLTGNYTFFNLLTIVLCIPLLDDTFVRRFFPRAVADAIVRRVLPEARPRPLAIARALGLGVLASVILLTSGVVFGTTLTGRSLLDELPAPLANTVITARRLRLVGGYGLFATMTTRRPEIVVEGSDDGETWRAYAFRYKAGDLHRPPPFVAPHQPRLDWQMWFAALRGSYERVDWFPSFARRLLDGSPVVLALLEDNPFPDAPPRFIRARIMDYTFTDWQTRAETGAWWQAGADRLFLPPVSLDNFRR